LAIYDITLTLSAGAVVYPGDPPVEITPFLSTARGDAFNLSKLSLGVHTLTHVDAPSHFIEGGATAAELPLYALCGRAQVIDLSEKVPPGSPIGIEDVANVATAERILLKTANHALWQRGEFAPDYVHLSKEAAAYLIRAGVKLVGIDYYSVDAYGDAGYPVHRALLENSVIVAENLYLKDVPAGFYDLILLPLRIAGADGAPARGILKSLKDE